jgi:hypothetical protein
MIDGDMMRWDYSSFVLLDQIEAREDDFVVFLLSFHFDAFALPVGGRGGWA